MERAQLEAKAVALGLPWDQSTTDEALEVLIRRAEIEGSLAALKNEPRSPCLGKWWDEPGSEHCQGCLDAKACFSPTATLGIDAVLSKPPFNGDPEFDPSILGVEMGISEDGMAALLERRKELGWEFKGSRPDAAQQELVPGTKRKKAPPKKGRPKPRPTPAGSAQSAADPAISEKGADPSAGIAEEPAGESTPRIVGSPGRKSLLIERLRPGDQLERTYKGKTWVCEVTPEGFLMDGQLYITLTQATQAITGTISCRKQQTGSKRPSGYREVAPYSAPKFWDLAKQLARLRSQDSRST